MSKLILCLSLFLVSLFASHANAYMNEHPITFRFVDAHQTPVAGLKVISQESLERYRCKFSLSVCGGDCNTVELVNFEQPAVTDENGSVTFIYDHDSLVNKVKVSRKLEREWLKQNSHASYWISILDTKGAQFQCYQDDFSKSEGVPFYSSVTWRMGNNPSDQTTTVTCQMK